MLSILVQLILMGSTFQKVDLHDTVLLSPLKIQHQGSQAFLLDWRLPGLVFLRDGAYEKRVGQKGKGPSDFYFLKSFSVTNEGVFVLNDILAEIKQFDLKGNFKNRLLTSMEQTESPYANDILVTDQYIYISFSKASIPLKRFNLEGKQLKQWSVPLREYPSNIGHPFHLFEKRGHVFLFNRFDGTLFQLDSKSDSVTRAQDIQIPGFGLILENEIKNAKERQKANQKQLVSTSYFLPLFETQDGFKAIESDPIHEDGMIHRSYDYQNKEVSQVDFSGLPSKPVCIKAIAGQTYVIDYDGDLYVKNGVL